MSRFPLELIAELRRLGLSISGTYPYAFRLATPLRKARPEWIESYKRARPDLASLELTQGRDYGLVAFLEAGLDEDGLAELDRLCADYLGSARAEHSWLVELDNTVRWYRGLAAIDRGGSGQAGQDSPITDNAS